MLTGASTYKMKFGNRGMNQPVVDLRTQRCYITAQNHGFAVDQSSLPSNWVPLMVNANDGANEGIIHSSRPLWKRLCFVRLIFVYSKLCFTSMFENSLSNLEFQALVFRAVPSRSCGWSHGHGVPVRLLSAVYHGAGEFGGDHYALLVANGLPEGWRQSLVGWRPSQVGWRPSLVGWRPSLSF